MLHNKTAKMSTQKACKVNFVNHKPKIAYPTVKEIRKICKEDSQLIKQWPADCILKWNDDTSLMCEICGLFSSNLSNLRRHKQQLHDRESLAALECPDCFKKFFRMDNYVRHLKKYCPVMKYREEAPRPVNKYVIEAANTVIQDATQTSKRKIPQWALTPIDFEPVVCKPKRSRRNATSHTAPIPLRCLPHDRLPDPRSNTPITDDDALLIERMLEDEQPQNITHSPNISIDDPTWVNNTDLQTIPESDDEWLRSMVEGAMNKPENQSEMTEEKTKKDPETPSEDQSEKTTEKTSREVEVHEENQSEKTEEKTNEEHEHQDENQSEKTEEEKTNEETKNQQKDQSEKTVEKTNAEPEKEENPEARAPIRQPLLLNIRLPARPPNDGGVPEYLPSYVQEVGSIPPWEVFSSMRSVMPTIVHDNELYIVLDELRD